MLGHLAADLVNEWHDVEEKLQCALHRRLHVTSNQISATCQTLAHSRQKFLRRPSLRQVSERDVLQKWKTFSGTGHQQEGQADIVVALGEQTLDSTKSRNESS